MMYPVNRPTVDISTHQNMIQMQKAWECIFFATGAVIDFGGFPKVGTSTEMQRQMDNQMLLDPARRALSILRPFGARGRRHGILRAGRVSVCSWTGGFAIVADARIFWSVALSLPPCILTTIFKLDSTRGALPGLRR